MGQGSRNQESGIRTDGFLKKIVLLITRDLARGCRGGRYRCVQPSRFGSSGAIVQAARVSYGAGTRKARDDRGHRGGLHDQDQQQRAQRQAEQRPGVRRTTAATGRVRCHRARGHVVCLFVGCVRGWTEATRG